MRVVWWSNVMASDKQADHASTDAAELHDMRAREPNQPAQEDSPTDAMKVRNGRTTDKDSRRRPGSHPLETAYLSGFATDRL